MQQNDITTKKVFRPIQVELDTTGEFLSTTPHSNQTGISSNEHEIQLLTRNLHLLYSHRNPQASRLHVRLAGIHEDQLEIRGAEAKCPGI